MNEFRHPWAAAIGVGLCLALFGCEFAGPGLTRANFERIKVDGSMTRADVDKLLGIKGTDYAGDPGQQIAVGFEAIGNRLQDAARGPGGARAERTTYIRWGDDNRNVVCTFRGGKVVGKQQRGIH
jgi:hypothetical protein